MSYFVCFALTPRAGTRNHIFLVPRDDSATKERVSALAPGIQELVSQANRPSGSAVQEGWAVVWHQVRQRSTGRLAYEWVAAAWEPALPLPENVTSDLLSMLSGVLTQLAQAVEKGRWDRGSELFELWPELATYQKDFTQKISPVLLALSRSGSRPTRARAWKMARFGVLIGLCTAGLLIVPKGVSLWWDRLQHWWDRLQQFISPQETSPQRKDTTPRVRPMDLVRGLDSKPAPDWRQLADAVGIQSSVPEDQLLPKILERCEQLFASDEKELQLRQRSQISQRDFFEARLLDLLVLVEQELGRQPPKDLIVLVKSETLHSELRRLFPPGIFDPFGLVRGDPDWDAAAEFFRGYDRHQLVQWVQIVREKRPIDGWSVPTDIRRAFGTRYNDLYQAGEWLEEVISCTLPQSGLSRAPGARRRFYLLEDQWVLDIYRAFAATVAGSGNEGQSFAQWRQGVPQRVSRVLRALQEEEESADTAVRLWQDRLNAILAVLHQ